jgi:hypothetical protein
MQKLRQLDPVCSKRHLGIQGHAFCHDVRLVSPISLHGLVVKEVKHLEQSRDSVDTDNRWLEHMNSHLDTLGFQLISDPSKSCRAQGSRGIGHCALKWYRWRFGAVELGHFDAFEQSVAASVTLQWATRLVRINDSREVNVLLSNINAFNAGR